MHYVLPSSTLFNDRLYCDLVWRLARRTFCSLLWPSNFGRDHFRGRIGPYNRDPAPEWQPSFGIGKVYWASQHPVDWSLYVDRVRKSCSSSLKESLEELLEISLNFRLRERTHLFLISNVSLSNHFSCFKRESEYFNIYYQATHLLLKTFRPGISPGNFTFVTTKADPAEINCSKCAREGVFHCKLRY